jgi:hypothetical protein
MQAHSLRRDCTDSLPLTAIADAPVVRAPERRMPRACVAGMDELLLELLGAMVDGVIPERVHEVLTRVIVGLAGTALAALGLYAAYETISAAEPMGILLVAMAFGMSAYCARLLSVDIRSSNPRTP